MMLYPGNHAFASKGHDLALQSPGPLESSGGKAGTGFFKKFSLWIIVNYLN